MTEQPIDNLLDVAPQRPSRCLAELDTTRQVTRVVVLEDAGLINESIRCGLDPFGDIDVVAATVSRPRAVQAIAQCTPTVLLIDLHRAARSVIEDLRFCRWLAKAHPSIGVLAMTRVADERLVTEVIRSGARAHISVNATSDELARAVREVAAGGQSRERRPAGSRLTDREYQILLMVAHGKTNSEISEALWISSRTVKFHVKNVMRKLDTLRRAEMVFAASQRGLL